MWTSNMSLSGLYNSHNVEITDGTHNVMLKIPNLRELLSTEGSIAFQLVDDDYLLKFQKSFNIYSPIQVLEALLCNPQITNIAEFSVIKANFQKALQFMLPDFRIKDRHLFVGEIALTDDLWRELAYTYSLGCGRKVEKPEPIPTDPKEREFYFKKKEMREKIAATKKRQATTETQKDNLMDVFTIICYKFPQYTFSTLYDLTMYQINDLQNRASKIISYENNMAAYTNGNLKEVPDFFI